MCKFGVVSSPPTSTPPFPFPQEASRASGARSACFAAFMLFLTDGTITGGKEGQEVGVSTAGFSSHLLTRHCFPQLLDHVAASNTNDANVRILTYSLGIDADKGIMKQIACANQGIWYHIDDSR